MTLFSLFTRLCFVMAVGALIGALAAGAFGQTPAAPAPAPTCEAQLSQAQKVILQLRKDKAGAEWQAAEALEQVLKLQEAAKPPVPPVPTPPAGK